MTTAGLEHCWVCGCAEATIYKTRNHERPLESADLEITDSRYGLTLALRRCQECGFIYAADDELRRLNRLYECLEDAEYEQTQDSRSHQMRWLLKRIARLSPRAETLLDIGAGAGLLVREARKLGLDAVGIEPSRSLVQGATRVNGVNLLQGCFPHPKLEDKKFDVITMVDVIEHVTEPVELLREAAAALTATGMLLVITPDVESVAARLFKGRWWHFRLAHVGYFNRSTLLRAAEGARLQALHICRPKWFFQIGYLALRLQNYLPLHAVSRSIRKLPAGSWLYSRTMPVNLHDSLAVFLQARDP